ncbi:MAG: phosphatidylglycerophosphatase A [Pseudomonadota bacterium]
MSIARAVATLAGTGYLRPASGTWGSAAAVPVGWALHSLGGPVLLALGTIALFFVGLWAVDMALAEFNAGEDPDRSEFVVDEAVGQWLALLPVSLGAWRAEEPMLSLWPGMLVAFLAFRLFDIVKPWPANALDRRKDPFGVMADDVAAGIYAAGLVMVAAALAHGLFMPEPA